MDTQSETSYGLWAQAGQQSGKELTGLTRLTGFGIGTAGIDRETLRQF
jgi:hypothetical protein